MMMSKKLPARIDLSVLMIFMGVIAIFYSFVVTGIFLIVMGTFNLVRWKKLKFLRELPSLLRVNLDNLDIVKFGYRWIGKDAKIIACTKPDIYDYGRVKVRIVCKTSNEKWFIIDSAFIAERALEFDISTDEESKAKSLLLSINRDLCEKHFGKFEIA